MMAATKIGFNMSSRKSFRGDFTLVSEDWCDGRRWIESSDGTFLDEYDLLAIISDLQERADGS